MTHIYVLHENEAWISPLAAAFEQEGLPWREWYLDQGAFDISAPPPEGIFYSRLSASSHTRGHADTVDLSRSVIAWLERFGRRVINGGHVPDLEVSKVRQYAAMEALGIRVPRTVIVAGKQNLVGAARKYFATQEFIVKPNCGGKGLGVMLFQTPESLASHIETPAYEAPVDGIHLMQEYIRSPERFITRAEFVGGKYMYAVRVDTSGGFELCPADACAVGDAFCPTGEAEARPKFEVIADIDAAQKAGYERLLAQHGIDVAGIEFIRDANGVVSTYDINTNTNYNSEAEAKAGKSGMRALARYLGAELTRRYPIAKAAE